MNDFLVSALIVFLVSLIAISLVFLAAIRYRLLPVQAEIAMFVEQLFFHIQRGARSQILVAGTSAGVWAARANKSGFKLATVSTVAAATFFFIPLSVTPKLLTVRMQIGRGELSENEQNNKPLPAEFINWKTSEVA